MKAYASTLAALGLEAQEKRSRYRARRERTGPGTLVEVHDDSVPFSSVERVANRLGVESGELLKVIGIAGRTAIRRKAQGYLRAEEADRLLRVARVLEEASRVFGTAEKAATWLRTAHPLLGDWAPYRLLDSDAGAKAVSDELVRIDFGDFA